jgi:C1A family cysteine protease
MWKSSPEYASTPDFQEVKHLLSTSFTPSDGSLRLPESTPISSQGSAGSCTANATCDAFEMIMPEPVQLSRRFVYWNAMRFRREESADNGSDLFACFTSMNRQGVCEESIWPYDQDSVLVRPSLLAYERAYDNRLATFYAIKMYGNAGLLTMDDALHAGQPIAFGMRIKVSDFRNYKGGDEVIEAPSNTDGGHAMIIVGYKMIGLRKVYIFRNSWSVSWGNRGYGLISAEYLNSPLYSAEFYVPMNLILTP